MNELVDKIRDFIHGNGIQAFIIAFLILLITGFVAFVLTRIMRKLMHTDANPFPASSILLNIVRISVWAVGLSFMLSSCFNVNVNGVLTALGVGGIAVSLGLQNTIQNFIGGLLITLMKIIKPGDHIKVNEVEGIVKDVSWRQTLIYDLEGHEHLIPNMVISSAAVEVYDPKDQVVTPFVFAYSGGDPQTILSKMAGEAKESVAKVARLKTDPHIVLTGIQSGALAATMRFELHDMKDTRAARDAAMKAIAPYAVAGALKTKTNDEGSKADKAESKAKEQTQPSSAN